jgi:hypothetical protein
MQPALPLHLPAPAGLQAQLPGQTKQQPQQQQQDADAALRQQPAHADVDASSSSSSSGSTQQKSSSIPQAATQESNSSSGGSTKCSRGSSCSGAEPSRMHAAVAAVVRHPIAELLNQVLLLVGYFCVQAPSNQAMLLFGRSPNILQRLCSMPFQYFNIPELRAVAMPTLLSVCCGADRTCEVVAQHVSLEMLLQFVRQQLEQQHQQLAEARQEQQIPQQQQQQVSVGCIPAEVQLLLQRLVSPPCGGNGSTSSSSSSSGGPFSLARRFPLAALQEAEAYLQKQLQGQQATGAASCSQTAVAPASAVNAPAS